MAVGTGTQESTRHKTQRACVTLGATGVREMDTAKGRGQVEARAGLKAGMRRSLQEAQESHILADEVPMVPRVEGTRKGGHTSARDRSLTLSFIQMLLCVDSFIHSLILSSTRSYIRLLSPSFIVSCLTLSASNPSFLALGLSGPELHSENFFFFLTFGPVGQLSIFIYLLIQE